MSKSQINIPTSRNTLSQTGYNRRISIKITSYKHRLTNTDNLSFSKNSLKKPISKP